MSEERRIIPPENRHACMTEDFPDDVQRIGTLAPCARCGTWYRLIATDWGPSRTWKRLGFWDFRDRRRVREFEEREARHERRDAERALRILREEGRA